MMPSLAILTKGHYYLLRHDDGILEAILDEEGTPSSIFFMCVSFDRSFERPDVLYSHNHSGVVCPSCKSTER